MDIVNGITPPVTFNEPEWWRLILALVMLVLLLVLLAPVLPYIIQGIVWFFAVPMRYVRNFFRMLFPKRKKKPKPPKKE